MCLSVCLWSEPVSDGNVGIISGEMSKPGARRDIDARREMLSRCRMVSEAIQQRSKAQRNATGDDLKVRQSREKDNINYGGVSEKRNLHIGLDFTLSGFHIYHGPRTGDRCEGLFFFFAPRR